MIPMKLVVSGPVGAGKTTFVQTLSETPVVSTEADASEDIGKATTTVAFDFGTLVLDGTELHVDALLEPGAAATRYSFQMVLDLRSRPLGRWNRLDLRAYDSVRVGSGEAVPLALKNERPFWFSKVKSYA